jgi:recombination protein U
MRALTRANRGQALEELIMLANDHYRANRIGVIHKVPTEWKPIRGKASGSGIISAKVEKKASVDFLGHISTKNGPLPLAFDAKETIRDRWPLSNLEQHQFEYLRDSHETGAFAFLLIGYWTHQRFFILPFPELESRWTAWKAGTGPASIRITDARLLEVKFFDYLNFLRKGMM